MHEIGSYSVTHNVMCLKLLRIIVMFSPNQDQVCKPVQALPKISGHACIMAFYVNVWDANGKSSLDGCSGICTFIF